MNANRDSLQALDKKILAFAESEARALDVEINKISKTNAASGMFQSGRTLKEVIRACSSLLDARRELILASVRALPFEYSDDLENILANRVSAYFPKNLGALQARVADVVRKAGSENLINRVTDEIRAAQDDIAKKLVAEIGEYLVTLKHRLADPADYWGMSDDDLERLADRCGLSPYSRSGTEGQSWYVDRERIIKELVFRDATLRAASAPAEDRSMLEKETTLISNALWVLDCETSGKQGTAFALRDVGLITCQHVLGPATKAYRPEDHTRKYDTHVLAQDETLDLAVLKVAAHLGLGLARDDPQALQHGDDIKVSGFPNYYWGQTAVITGGKVIGFRPRSAIRRILTDAHIAKGASGGPATVSSLW